MFMPLLKPSMPQTHSVPGFRLGPDLPRGKPPIHTSHSHLVFTPRRSCFPLRVVPSLLCAAIVYPMGGKWPRIKFPFTPPIDTSYSHLVFTETTKLHRNKETIHTTTILLLSSAPQSSTQWEVRIRRLGINFPCTPPMHTSFTPRIHTTTILLPSSAPQSSTRWAVSIRRLG